MVYYSCKGLLERAAKIRTEAPALLNDGNWEMLEKLLTIGDDVWCGPSAESYSRLVEMLMNDRSKKAEDVIRILPDVLEADVKRMQEADQEVAELVHRNLGNLTI